MIEHVQLKINHPTSSNRHPSATANKATQCLKWVWVKNQRKHHIILTKYAAVHPAAVSEKEFLVSDTNKFEKTSGVHVLYKGFAGLLTYIVSKGQNNLRHSKVISF